MYDPYKPGCWYLKHINMLRQALLFDPGAIPQKTKKGEGELWDDLQGTDCV